MALHTADRRKRMAENEQRYWEVRSKRLPEVKQIADRWLIENMILDGEAETKRLQTKTPKN